DGEPLGLVVGHVVGAGAEDEVVGIHAAAHVAAVAQDHAGRDRPVLQRPGEPVRRQRLVADVELAVARMVDRAVPDVAARQRIDRGVVGEPLGRRQAVVTGGELAKAGLGHERPRYARGPSTTYYGH